MANLPRKFDESKRLKLKKDINYYTNQVGRQVNKRKILIDKAKECRDEQQSKVIEQFTEEDHANLERLITKLKNLQLEYGNRLKQEIHWRNQRLNKLKKEIKEKGGLDKVPVGIAKEKDENKRILKELDIELQNLPVHILKELEESPEDSKPVEPSSSSKRKYSRGTLLGVSIVSLITFLGLSIWPFTCPSPISAREPGITDYLVNQDNQLGQISGVYPVWVGIGSTHSFTISIKPEYDKTKAPSEFDRFPKELPDKIQTDFFQSYFLMPKLMYIEFEEGDFKAEFDKEIEQPVDIYSLSEPMTWAGTIKVPDDINIGCRTIKVRVFEKNKYYHPNWLGFFQVLVVTPQIELLWLITGITGFGGGLTLLLQTSTTKGSKSETNKEDIKKLICKHNRRLQKLKEQVAIAGHSVDPKVLIEIEDIEATIEELETKLKVLEKI